MKGVCFISLLIIPFASCFGQIVYSHDTSSHITIVKQDPNLYSPTLKQPSLCKSFRNSWDDYLKKNRKDFDDNLFETDSSFFSGVLYFTIDKKGRTVVAQNQKFSNMIESVCFNLFKETLQKAKWNPAFRKTKNGKRYLDSHTSMSIEIAKGWQLKEIRLTDFRTKEEFYKCVFESRY